MNQEPMQDKDYTNTVIVISGAIVFLLLVFLLTLKRINSRD